MRHDDFDEICAAKGETIQTRPRLPPELWSKIFDIAWGMHIPCKKCWDRAATLFDDHQDSWPPEYRFTALAWAIKRKCLPIAEWLDEKGPSAKRKGSKLLQWMIDQSFEDPMEYCDHETEYLQMWIELLEPRECMDLLTEIYEAPDRVNYPENPKIIQEQYHGSTSMTSANYPRAVQEISWDSELPFWLTEDGLNDSYFKKLLLFIPFDAS